MPGTGSASVDAQGWVGEPPQPDEPETPEGDDDEPCGD